MKKLICIFVIAFAVFVTNAYSQCPTGYMPRTVNIRVNGCLYEVSLCVKCSVLGYIPDCVAVTGFMQIPEDPVCTQTLNAQQVLQQIESQVENPDFWNTWLCSPVVPPPPCPSKSDPITIIHYYCWKMIGDMYFGDFVIRFVVCNTESGCEETISWCYDPVSNTNQRIVESGPTSFGNMSSTLEGWEIVVPTEPNEESGCYIYHTPCNPDQP